MTVNYLLYEKRNFGGSDVVFWGIYPTVEEAKHQAEVYTKDWANTDFWDWTEPSPDSEQPEGYVAGVRKYARLPDANVVRMGDFFLMGEFVVMALHDRKFRE